MLRGQNDLLYVRQCMIKKTRYVRILFPNQSRIYGTWHRDRLQEEENDGICAN